MLSHIGLGLFVWRVEINHSILEVRIGWLRKGFLNRFHKLNVFFRYKLFYVGSFTMEYVGNHALGRNVDYKVVGFNLFNVVEFLQSFGDGCEQLLNSPLLLLLQTLALSLNFFRQFLLCPEFLSVFAFFFRFLFLNSFPLFLQALGSFLFLFFALLLLFLANLRLQFQSFFFFQLLFLEEQLLLLFFVFKLILFSLFFQFQFNPFCLGLFFGFLFFPGFFLEPLALLFFGLKFGFPLGFHLELLLFLCSSDFFFGWVDSDFGQSFDVLHSALELEVDCFVKILGHSK